MDKNKDGVVTLEEFVVACQEVGSALNHALNHHCLQKAFSSQQHLKLVIVLCQFSDLIYLLIVHAG